MRDETKIKIHSVYLTRNSQDVLQPVLKTYSTTLGEYLQGERSSIAYYSRHIGGGYTSHDNAFDFAFKEVEEIRGAIERGQRKFPGLLIEVLENQN